MAGGAVVAGCFDEKSVKGLGAVCGRFSDEAPWAGVKARALWEAGNCDGSVCAGDAEEPAAAQADAQIEHSMTARTNRK